MFSYMYICSNTISDYYFTKCVSIKKHNTKVKHYHGIVKLDSVPLAVSIFRALISQYL